MRLNANCGEAGYRLWRLGLSTVRDGVSRRTNQKRILQLLDEGVFSEDIVVVNVNRPIILIPLPRIVIEYIRNEKRYIKGIIIYRRTVIYISTSLSTEIICTLYAVRIKSSRRLLRSKSQGKTCNQSPGSRKKYPGQVQISPLLDQL
jgi:hypothetical protein